MVILWAFENSVWGPKERALHMFTSKREFTEFLKSTEGLREWNPGARYIARDSEVESWDANHIIRHGPKQSRTPA